MRTEAQGPGDRPRYGLTELLILVGTVFVGLIDWALYMAQKARVASTISRTAAHLQRSTRGGFGYGYVLAQGIIAGHLLFPRLAGDPLTGRALARMAALALAFLVGEVIGNRWVYQSPP